MKDTKELLDFEIYPHLDRAEAVKDLNPQDGRIDATIKVKATFHDGETMMGTALAFNRDREGFFLTPTGTESNNTRVFVIFNAVEKMETWK